MPSMQCLYRPGHHLHKNGSEESRRQWDTQFQRLRGYTKEAPEPNPVGNQTDYRTPRRARTAEKDKAVYEQCRVVHYANLFQNNRIEFSPIIVLGYDVKYLFKFFNNYSRAPLKPLKTSPNFLSKTVAKLHAFITNFINSQINIMLLTRFNI